MRHVLGAVLNAQGQPVYLDETGAAGTVLAKPGQPVLATVLDAQGSAIYAAVSSAGVVPAPGPTFPLTGWTSLTDWIWYKADSMSLADNTRISAWTDSSGNNRNAEQAAGAQQPRFRTNQQNNLPGIEFDDVARNMQISPATLSFPSVSFFFVGSMTLVAGVAAPLMTINSNVAYGFDVGFQDPRPTQLYVHTINMLPTPATIMRRNTNNTFVAPTVTALWEFHATISTGPILEIIRAGVVQAMGVTSSPAWGNTYSLNGSGSGGTWMMHELIAKATLLSAGDRTLIRDYLNTKWGL